MPPFGVLRTYSAWPGACSWWQGRTRLRRLRLTLLLLLQLRRCVALRVTHRYGLWNGRGAISLAIANDGRGRLTVIVRPVDARRNEEQNLARLT